MRAAVLGSPVAHSLSPLLHRAAYAALGLDWTYDAVQVSPETLRLFLQSLDSTWAGVSLTLPLTTLDAPPERSYPSFGPRSRLGRGVLSAKTDRARQGSIAGGGKTPLSTGCSLGGRRLTIKRLRFVVLPQPM